MLMTAKPRPAVALTSDHLRTIADQLAEWSETLRKVAEVAEKQENKEIAVFNWLSVPKGLQLTWFVLDAIPKGEPAGNGAYVYNGQYVQPSAFIRMALVSTVFVAFILALPATIASVIAYFFCKKS